MIAIQPCALLLLVGSDWRIEAVSANIGMLGDHRPAAVFGQPLGDVIGSKAIHSLRNRMSWLSSDESEVQDFGAQWGDVLLDVRASRQDSHFLIEAELAVEPRLPDGIGMVRSMTDRLTCSDPGELAEQAMRQLSTLSGFDRLSLRNRRGDIITTVGRELPVPELDGPDISLPRIIADRDAGPVPTLGDAVPDLMDRAAFLAPDATQMQLMAAQGIAASMALPLCIDREQVATVHAHHPIARRIGAERRSVAHLFAERLAARMARRGFAF